MHTICASTNLTCHAHKAADMLPGSAPGLAIFAAIIAAAVLAYALRNI